MKCLKKATTESYNLAACAACITIDKNTSYLLVAYNYIVN